MGETERKASQAIDNQRAVLAEEIVARQYERQPALWRPYGDTGRDLSVRDAGYHLAYLSEALAAADPTLFADYVQWVKVLFAGLGFPEDVLPTTLECTREVLASRLAAAEAAVATRYLAAGLELLPGVQATVPSFLEPEAPLAELANQYLEKLLQGQRHEASQLILETVARGGSVKDIYLYVFQRAQHEIGRLWQMNRVSVAQEHYCTAATQLIMSQLYGHIFSTERVGRRLVAACVGGELHEIGVRMVADFFEMEGWDTYYLGANTPPESVVRTVAERRPDILGISATMTFHVREAARLIEWVRASEVGRAVRILIGGYPFNVAPELWRQVGADGNARDAQAAVQLANQMVRAT